MATPSGLRIYALIDSRDQNVKDRDATSLDEEELEGG